MSGTHLAALKPFPGAVFPQQELLDRLLATSRQQGFESGYQQALRDQLEGLVLQAERFLAGPGAGKVDRKVLYAFVARLQEGLQNPGSIRPADCWDGLGI